jgi:large subunit ribosomal protein L22
MITASLKNYRISPRKVRLVADMIRGKKVVDAEAILAFAIKKAKSPLGDLLDSAIANAKNNFKLEKDNLYVKEIMVNQGYVLKRSMPVSRGSAHPIKKRTSHVRLVLAVKEQKVAKGNKKSNKNPK